MVAEAKSQYPLSVGRALQKLKSRTAVFDASNALYELAQIRGTVAFRGFDGEELRVLDAASAESEKWLLPLWGRGASLLVRTAPELEVEFRLPGRSRQSAGSHLLARRRSWN